MPENNLDRLRTLMRTTSQPAIAITTLEEAEALALVRDAAADLGQTCTRWTITKGLHDAAVEDYGQIPQTDKPHVALTTLTAKSMPGVFVFLDLGRHLDDAAVHRALREAMLGARQRGQLLVLIDGQPIRDPAVLQYAASYELHPPQVEQIERLVRAQLRALHRHGALEIELKRSTWEAMIRNLRGLTPRQIRNIIAEAVADDRRLDDADLPTIIGRKREYVQADGLLEFIDAPISLEDIGGLERLKRWLASRCLGERATEAGLEPPRGVLMLGVQGAGKSLCAKAISAAWKRPLLRLDPTALYDRYVGESERRLRSALHQAELMAPIILWIDEIEKGFAAMGQTTGDGGLSRRMFGSLLTWMQEHREPVFLVATANDIESLPPELMRKGRFDEIFFVDLPGQAARQAIIGIHLRKRRLDPQAFDLPAIVQATEGYSGAEIEQAIIAATHEAFATGKPVTTQLLLRCLADSPPLSVTMAEKVASLRAWAQGRCVMAD